MKGEGKKKKKKEKKEKKEEESEERRKYVEAKKLCPRGRIITKYL